MAFTAYKDQRHGSRSSDLLPPTVSLGIVLGVAAALIFGRSLVVVLATVLGIAVGALWRRRIS